LVILPRFFIGDRGYLGDVFGSIDPETEFNPRIPERTPTKIKPRSILDILMCMIERLIVSIA